MTWINNFLIDRTQYVKISGSRSFISAVAGGAPQDSALGPTLYPRQFTDIVLIASILKV